MRKAFGHEDVPMPPHGRAVAVAEQKTVVRTDYRCRAHGCWNAGSIEDKCYFHWCEKDSGKWDAITQRIKETWPRMANHGTDLNALLLQERLKRDAANALLNRVRDGADVPTEEINEALQATGEIPQTLHELPTPAERARYATDPRFAQWEASAPAMEDTPVFDEDGRIVA